MSDFAAIEQLDDQALRAAGEPLALLGGDESLLELLRADAGAALARRGGSVALRRRAWQEVAITPDGNFEERLREAGWATIDANGPRPKRMIFLSPPQPPLAERARRRGVSLLRAGGKALIARLGREPAPRPWHEELPWSLLAEPRPPRVPPRPEALRGRLRINFVVPAFFAGSGGHMTIFRLAEQLETNDHDCLFLFTHGEGLLPPQGALVREQVRRHFRPIRGRCLHWTGQELPEADVHVATHWDTAAVVDRRRRSGAGAYLVQDWEPSFYPAGTRAAAAEQTYALGLLHITAGPWLARKLRMRGAQAEPFDLAVDHAEYFPEPAAQAPARPRIAVYLRPLTERRGFELVALALRELLRKRPEVEVVAYGAAPADLPLPFAATKPGVLGSSDLRRLYSSSTIGLSCSLTNHGLVPQEMWASGLPVVEVDAESTRAVYRDGEDAVLAPLEPLALAARLEQVLDDAPLRARLRQAGLERAAKLSWARSGTQVEAALRKAVERELNAAQRAPGSSPPQPA